MNRLDHIHHVDHRAPSRRSSRYERVVAGDAPARRDDRTPPPVATGAPRRSPDDYAD